MNAAGVIVITYEIDIVTYHRKSTEYLGSFVGGVI